MYTRDFTILKLKAANKNCLRFGSQNIRLYCVHIDKTFELTRERERHRNGTHGKDEKNLLRPNAATINVLRFAHLCRSSVNWRHIIIIIMWIYYSNGWVFLALSLCLSLSKAWRKRTTTNCWLRSFWRNKVSFRFTSNTFYWALISTRFIQHHIAQECGKFAKIAQFSESTLVLHMIRKLQIVIERVSPCLLHWRKNNWDEKRVWIGRLGEIQKKYAHSSIIQIIHFW